MVEIGKKIWVKNKVFEIIQDADGLTLYEILSNGIRQEAVVDKETFISIIVAMSDEKKNKPETQPVQKMSKHSKIKALVSLFTVLTILISNSSLVKNGINHWILNKDINSAITNADYLQLAIKTNPHIPSKMIPIIKDYLIVNIFLLIITSYTKS